MKRRNEETNVAVLPDGESAVIPTETTEKTETQSRKHKAKERTEEDVSSFWDYAAGLGDQWQTGNLKIWVYRVSPKIDVQEDRVYIAIVQEPIDEEYLLQHYGSGRYLMMLKDRSKLLRKHTASVYDQALPPKVHESQVLNIPANDSYFRTWGRKSDDAIPKAEKSQPSAPADVNTLLNTVLDKTGSFDPKLAELWERTAKERDEMSKKLAEKNAPPDMVSFIKGIKDLFPTQATAASGKSETLEIIAAIKNLQQDPLAIMQQAKELFESPEPVREPQRDEIDRLDKVLGFAQKLTALRPSNGAAPDAWAAGLDFAREVTPGLMQLLNNFMVLKSQSNGATAPVPGMAAAGATPPASFDPYRDAAALKNHARMMNQQAAAAAPGAASSQPVNAPNAAAQTPPPPAAAGTQPPNEIQALLANYGALVLSALNGGQSGAEFAENVARLFGDATPLLIGNHGEAALTEAMLATPELRLFGQARLQRFAHEFIHWQEILEAEEGEEEVASEANA